MDKLIVLGTGEAISTEYYNTCFALYDGSEYFLVDGGGGNTILRQLKLAGIDWNRLHHAFISHQHTDHILGMVWVLRTLAHKCERKEYTGHFYLYGHFEVLSKVYTICSLTLKPGDMEKIGKTIHLVPVEDKETRKIGSYSVEFFDILSTKAKQYAWKLELTNGKTLVFAGDEPCAEPNWHYIEHCDWLLSEAYCLDRDEAFYDPHGMNHNTVKDTSMLAEQRHVKNLVLWHTEDKTYGSRRTLYTQEAKEYYTGNIYVPDDLDVIELV